MDFKRMIERDVVEYSDFEKEILLHTIPSKVGKKSSDLEQIYVYQDMFAKFDFSVVTPNPNLNKFLEGTKKKLSTYFKVDNIPTKDLKDAYKLRSQIISNLGVLIQKHVDKKFIGKRSNEMNLELIQNPKEFKYALNELRRIFPKETHIFAYGSAIQKSRKQSDFDFRIVVPELDVDKYAHYIENSKRLSKYKIPITYGLLTENNFNTYQLSDKNEVLSTNKSMLVQGELDIFDSDLKQDLKFIAVGHMLSKIRSSLIKKTSYEIPKILRARSNEVMYSNALLCEIFGDRGLEFPKFYEEKLSNEEVKERLIYINNSLHKLLETYKSDIQEKLNSKF